MAQVTLHICTTCRQIAGVAGDDPLAPRPGRVLMEALTAGDLPDGVRLQGVECLSACTQGCAVALTAPGKWTYVYGRLDPALHGAAILDGAARYAASTDGVVPWRERPEVFRKQCLARIPPQIFPSPEPEDV